MKVNSLSKVKTRRKKSERQKLETKLDSLFRIEIRGRGYCQAQEFDDIQCGGVLQTCHIVGRANRTLRWDDMNALCLCAGHHVFYTHNPEKWRDFIQTNFPQNWDYVEKNRTLITKNTLDALKQMIENWQ